MNQGKETARLSREGERRSRITAVRFRPYERQALESLAKSRGETISALVRKLVGKELAQQI